jgi:hypothetical protein
VTIWRLRVSVGAVCKPITTVLEFWLIWGSTSVLARTWTPCCWSSEPQTGRTSGQNSKRSNLSLMYGANESNSRSLIKDRKQCVTARSLYLDNVQRGRWHTFWDRDARSTSHVCTPLRLGLDAPPSVGPCQFLELSSVSCR